MNNKPTFEHTVSILVKAYMNDQLEHKVCTACAVGNLVAYALGTTPMLLAKGTATKHECFLYENGEEAEWWNRNIGEHVSSPQQEMTGYTVDELNRIEIAFEFAEGAPDFSYGLSPDKTMNETWVFNGLMSVVDVLAEIHGIDLEQKESAKALFVK